MAFPDILEKDFSKDGKNNQDVRALIDYAVSQWTSKAARVKRINNLYNSYNGISSPAEIEAITKSTGKLSKTKFVQHAWAEPS
jgi:hypothetical protein